MSTNTPFIRLHPQDDVVIARTQIIGSAVVEGHTTRGLIPAGHKIATRDLAAGDAVRRYNQIIGFASRPIAAGEHVHTHNLNMGENKGDFSRDYAIGADVKPVQPLLEATFQGIKRADGRVATRNYIGILSSVNCSATAARAIADHFSRRTHPAALAAFPMVDGVVALTHGTGCGMDGEGLGLQVLQRTLSGYATHPNFAGVLVVGLGCESNQINAWLAKSSLAEGQKTSDMFQVFNIQDTGGTTKTIAKGIALIEAMLPKANAVHREPCSAAHITVGLQCGGSDGYSGISANPALGAAVDLLVAHGGTAILSETPEIYGAEHLLTRRAVNPAIAEKLISRIKWWENYTAINNGEMNNNPSPGNKAGGLTTILEKSLGAVAKGGTSNLNGVFEYAEGIDTHGFVYMDTPGYDPVSATGQVAGGANLICFTTGRGSAYGCAPSPSLKLATNTALWQRQEDDMDINCGDIVDGTSSVALKGQAIWQAILDAASGKATKSESHGYGQNEFVPWQLGAVM
jgi:altronate hydrolase